MLKRHILLALMLAAIGCAALPGGASAINTTGGEFDGNDHPAVGALLVETDEGVSLICSGTLISPTVFLTASHCTVGEDRVYVSFDPTDVEQTDALLAGTAHTNPDYKPPYQNDISVVVLDEPVVGIEPAKLPTEDLLGELDASGSLRDMLFTNVGYGTQEQQVVPGTGPTFPFTGDRWRSVSTFIALTPKQLHLGQRRAQGEGGTCYGDSGGPQFLGAGEEETDIVISVTSTGDGPCYATNVTTRTDTESALEFLSQFVDLS
jgi:secreted trypsin-like serine protease